MLRKGFAGRASKAVSGSKTSARSSGARALNFAKMNRGKTMAMGGAAIGAFGLARSRRSGLDKTRGRSTGMYKY